MGEIMSEFRRLAMRVESDFLGSIIEGNSHICKLPFRPCGPCGQSIRGFKRNHVR